MGVARALKELFPRVHIAAVEPEESPVMSGGKPGPHGIPGIGDGFIPDLVTGRNGRLDSLIDEVICISSEEAVKAARHIHGKHGYCVGISSGANFAAARKLSVKFRTTVTVFPDGCSRYISQGLGLPGNHNCLYKNRCSGALNLAMSQNK
jgi:cysteine synthase A